MRLLRTRVNEHTMSTWLEPITCEEITDGRVVLSVPNSFFISWIKDNYLDLITDSLSQVTGTIYDIRLTSRNETIADHAGDETRDTATDGAAERGSLTEEFALRHNLNPRYTFKSFVVGDCNNLAGAAGMAVAEKPGGAYNPLFIFAGVGLGKTHLITAIGHEVLSRDKSKKVSFATSEEFTNEMINAIRFGKMAEFRNKYRKVDLLLIDDIQFLAGKERTQEEFFHTFNSIYEARKQIVITSDRLPGELTDMEQRLKSRFSWGLVADMGVPDLETRVAILKRKANEDHIALPDDVAYLLAERAKSNVRDLVGSLIRVVAISTLQGLPLTRDLAESSLKDVLNHRVKPVTIDDIITHVSKSFNVKVSDVKSKKRHKLYALPRQIGMYLSRELTECSYPEIGTAFGGKDHSTVVYATRKIEKLLENDPSIKNRVEEFKRELSH